MTQRSSCMEISLGEKLFEGGLDAVLGEVRRRGLVCTGLRIDLIVDRNGQWESREKSTKPTPVIYLEIGQVPEALILQESGDDRYGMFRYRIHTS